MIDIESVQPGDIVVLNGHSNTSPEFRGAMCRIEEVIVGKEQVRVTVPDGTFLRETSAEHWNEIADFDNGPVHEELLPANRFDPCSVQSKFDGFVESEELNSLFEEYI